MGKSQKKLVRWGIKNISESTLIPFLIHGILFCCKGNLSIPSTNLSTQLEESFNKNKYIVWLQALTGILTNVWAETHNAYLKYIGAKVTGQRWVSSLIRKLWEVAWDMWNYRNHNLHTSYVPTKAEVLAHTNSIISYNFNRVTIGLGTRCHFIFNTKENTLLYLPTRQKLCYLAAISSDLRCDH